MQKTNFEEVIETICEDDSRYLPEAYTFVREGLDQTLKKLNRSGANKHVSGAELLDGLRQFTLEEFGPMGKLVLNEWGLHECRDFGEIVFNLVNHNVLGRSDSDNIEDFREIYTFEDAFEEPFRPQRSKSISSKARSNKGRASARMRPPKSKEQDPDSPLSPESNKS
ncbi:MAG: Minf_1886 family protein [Verrucomicrobiota bacterium]